MVRVGPVALAVDLVVAVLAEGRVAREVLAAVAAVVDLGVAVSVAAAGEAPAAAVDRVVADPAGERVAVGASVAPEDRDPALATGNAKGSRPSAAC